MRIIPCKTCGKPIKVYGAEEKPNYQPECQEHRLVGRKRVESGEGRVPRGESGEGRGARKKKSGSQLPLFEEPKR